MKKKGFTLIELLAVIVVLAVIALIATPIVLNLVKTAKIGSAEQSVTGYVKAIENTIIKDMINNKEVSDGTYKYDSIEADISGKRPTSGEYIVKNGRVESGNFCVDGYYIEYKNSTSKYNKDKKCDNSNSSVSSGVTKVEPTSTDTHKGIVYLDPTDLSKTCNESNSVSETETKVGCMKWYIYAEDDNSYTMILDHNTTATVAWNDSYTENTEMKEVKEALDSDTSTWDKSLNARLITADEVAHIVGADRDDTLKWSSTKTLGLNGENIDKNKYVAVFFLDGSGTTYVEWQTQVANSTNKSKYAWLYDYTGYCKGSGCNIEEAYNTTQGYWTSTHVVDSGSNTSAWLINNAGELNIYNVYSTWGSTIYGLRPVITVPKNVIK